MKTLVSLVSLFVLSSCSDSAAWSGTDAGTAVPLGSGAMHVKRHVNGPDDADLNLVFFDSTQFFLKMFAQNGIQKDARALAEVLRPSGAVAGTNGGYFELRPFGPAGLMISGGSPSGTLVTDNPLEGSLVVRDDTLSLVWSDELKTTAGITEMVQCNPILVRAGKAVGGFGDADGPKLPRTFVATDGRGKWVMGVCRKMTLTNLAKMLGSQKVITEFRIERALNLDGGPSSGLWCRDAQGKEITDPEGTRVQNIIALVPRK